MIKAVSTVGKLAMLCCGLLVLGACQSTPREALLSTSTTPADVLAGAPILADDTDAALPEVDVLAMNEDMVRFVEHYVDRRQIIDQQVRQLLRAITAKATFGLEYTTATYTAEQAFARRSGNCLSFTNMFVAMSRHLDIDARFQVVEVPPYWESRDGTMVLNSHINVLIDTEPFFSTNGGARKVVDFNIEDFKTSYKQEVISDRQALAHYHNNIGVEHLQAGRYRDAFLHLRRGLELDGRFSVLWSNLGTLYDRVGRPDYAEVGYLTALRHDQQNMVALSNLARLYSRAGQDDAALRLSERVRRFRDKNPYYRFHQARTAFQDGDLSGAIGHLEAAIRRKPEEDAFYFVMGLVYWALDERVTAQQYFDQAQDVAEDNVIRRRYGQKLRRLMADDAARREADA